jgi:RNA polymerase sigma factor (sigma-70 family)
VVRGGRREPSGVALSISIDECEMRGLISSSSDARVIAASVSRPEAFARVFDRHARDIWRYACRRVGPVAAEEVVGETFLRAFSGRAAYDAKQIDARPWLYGIAINVIREQARAQARRGRDLESRRENDLVDGGLDRVEARADAAATVPATVAALAQLEPIDRETLLLYALTDLHYGEIATAMQVPVGTVRSRLNRARRQMQTQLGVAEPTTPDFADERNQR